MADLSKIAAILNWPIQQNIKELQGFLGCSGYYRKFVKGYEKIAWVSMEQLKRENFHWNEEATCGFKSLQEAMTQIPVLALPDFNKNGDDICLDDVSYQNGSRSLKYLLEQRLVAGEYQKWLTKLMGYDFEIQYRPGKENSAADTLSKRVELTESTWEPIQLIRNQFPNFHLENKMFLWEEGPDMNTSQKWRKKKQVERPMVNLDSGRIEVLFIVYVLE
ncbi:hypothetical protein Tco_1546331 [Tanacetum coccineum]